MELIKTWTIDERIIKEATDKVGLTSYFTFSITFTVDDTLIGYYNRNTLIVKDITLADKITIDKKKNDDWVIDVKEQLSKRLCFISQELPIVQIYINKFFPEITREITVDDIYLSITEVKQ